MLAECGWDDAEVDIASRLEACKRHWDLAGDSRLGGGFRCAVFACLADGGQVVVKLTPTPEEARLEAAALASWAHTGAAMRLIDADISANILDPGRADDLGGELAVSRAAFAFPPRSLVTAISGVPRAVQIGDGQRVQAADQQAPALDLRVPRCGALFLVPAGTARRRTPGRGTPARS